MPDPIKVTTGKPKSEKYGSKETIDPEWAWSPYQPGEKNPWNLVRASHLYRRAAFGASWRQLEEALAVGPQRTIDGLLGPAGDIDSFNTVHDADAETAAGGGSTGTLRAWWLRRMLGTPHPLLEKMVLFWHDHFAIGNSTVGSAALMYDHVKLLRQHALGSLPSLIEGLVRDPAYLVGLEATANRKARPSLHLARALIETHCLGPGEATPGDLEGIARAFTGLFVLRQRLRFISREHDGGVKQILGKEGRFGDRDVARIILEHPALARFLAGKLYRWFISETVEPDPVLLAPLARILAEKRDLGVVVERILRSNIFFSPRALERRVKSPVEFALGIITALEGRVSTPDLGGDLAALGQDLYSPPTVKGWAGGLNWINKACVIRRTNLARSLLEGIKPYENSLDPWGVARKHGCADFTAAVDFLCKLLLGGEISKAARDGLRARAPVAGEDPGPALRGVAHALVTLPRFQLA